MYKDSLIFNPKIYMKLNILLEAQHPGLESHPVS